MKNYYSIVLNTRDESDYVDCQCVDSIEGCELDSYGCDDAYEQFSAWCRLSHNYNSVDHVNEWYSLHLEECDGMIEVAYFDPNDAFVTGPDVVMFSNSVYGVVPCY